ncbi:serine/threonine protein kinase 1 [Volvox carteri f. nagariensis]|uniref:Serine/threonine protein kinase 1 n=1 Tax=Volvox carteri f. nagariensis TaxID=3068 RepID=D8UC40_VOLCA|nr:serine/threonine protein kinase 1 [Volvox carteri f. nagariensis]EFJ42729.1 serine/threonine protein kinase 1 [Volvox carteri f. nagariensis]|eukprot:XP_002956190.1 serine/threonine protein kinase 1 [Volvox carteri f. nagariensis]
MIGRVDVRVGVARVGGKDVKKDGRSPQAPESVPHADNIVCQSEWVAVKIYKPLVRCELRYLEYLKREAVNQRRLNHEHVIGFKEVGLTTDQRLYLTLEYADSGSLKQWLAAQPGHRLPEATARWFAQQLVYGLSYCHAHGVYNRDIKPANLLLHSNKDSPQPLEPPLLKVLGIGMVADFGLCKSSADSVPKSQVGSPHYMAPAPPEVFSGKPYDGRKADVFSCGVVIFQMVFGVLPFSRTLDGRNLDFNRNFREIHDNMKNEVWKKLLPASSPTITMVTAPTNRTEAMAPSSPLAVTVMATAATASAGLLDLLYGMLRYDPDRRPTLLEVIQHAWYREGLPDSMYEFVLAGGAGADQRPPPASSQSVELIEVEFSRIMEHCAACQHVVAARQQHQQEAEGVREDCSEGQEEEEEDSEGVEDL